MAVSLAYPKDLFHPNGSKTVTVFDADEDKATQKLFAAWRASETEASAAAREGRQPKAAGK